jgi:hypothetical protein
MSTHVDRGVGMKGSIAFIAGPVLAAVAAPGAAVAGTRPYAPPQPSADLRMVYGSPELAADDSGVTWHWTLTNAGAAGAEAVVATHKVSPDQKIIGVSQPCANTGGDVVCRFGEIKPGERRSGWIRTSVAQPGARLHVNAQVTWHENVPARTQGPAIVEAGEPAGDPVEGAGDPVEGPVGGPAAVPSPRNVSWGVADTDVTTRMPDRSG